MRVCVVSDQVFPAWGGEGIATQNLCKKLSQRGHKILVLTTRVPSPPKVENIELVRFPSIFIHRRGYFAITFYSRIVSLLKKRKIEIIQVNLPTFLGWQALLAGRYLNIPRVAGFHVQSGNVLPPIFFPFKRLLELWFSYFFNQADILISPSELGKKILSGYCSKKVEVVSNGVDLGTYNPGVVSFEKSAEFRKKFSLKNTPFILYVGRLSWEKNVGYLIEVMRIVRKKIPRLKLMVVGEGKLKNKLEKTARLKGLSSAIIFTGFLPVEDLLCAYREAELFILPSFYELQSIVVLEAMAMQSPILVSDSDENAAGELVKEGINGYRFSLKDPEDAAEKIQRIVSQPALKKSMQEASLALVKEHDINRSILKIEQIYKGVRS